MSVSARLVIVLQACTTVAWSLLPMYLPILDVDISRCFFDRNIATWRTNTTSLLRERVFMLSTLSTALFCMSYEDGLSLIEKIGGVSALWVFNDGSFKSSVGFGGVK